ncbi:MAG: SIMPL domain-containing protein [Bacillota bacterium]
MESVKKENCLLLAVIIIGISVIAGLVLQWNSRNLQPVPATNGAGQGITVSGKGSVTVKPDIAYISLGVEAVGATAQAAQGKNAALMTKVVSNLKNLGLQERDIQTTDFNLFPERRYDKITGQEQVAGYRAINQLRVTVRDLSILGRIVDESIKAGANNVNNIAFTVEKPENWREKAIAQAVKDARLKAEALAKAAGVNLRKVNFITEGNVDVRPFQMDTIRKEQLAGAGMVNTPIEPGNVKVTAEVQMNFAI